MRKEALFSLLIILLFIGLVSAACYHCEYFDPSPQLCSGSKVDCIDDTPDNSYAYAWNSNCFCSSSSPSSPEWDDSVCKASYFKYAKGVNYDPVTGDSVISSSEDNIRGFQVNKDACSPCKGERGAFNRVLVSDVDFQGGRKEGYVGECVCSYNLDEPEYKGCYVYIKDLGYYQCSHTTRHFINDDVIYSGVAVYHHLLIDISTPEKYFHLNNIFYSGACRPVYNCEPPACSGDIDGDGHIGINDLIALGEDWLCEGDDCYADLDCDGYTNLVDFAELSANWLKECN